jgi:hypothetical protein
LGNWEVQIVGNARLEHFHHGLPLCCFDAGAGP